MEQLIQLEQKLIEKAKAQSEAVHVAEQASTAYETALEKIMVANPELRALMTSEINAKSAAKEAKDHYTETKANAVTELLALTDPEDIKDIDAFGYRRSVGVAISDERGLIQRLVETDALWLLTINSGALKSFVKGAAFEHEGTYILPCGVSDWLGHCADVDTVIKPTISDAKISKLAGAYVEKATGS